MKNIIIVSLVLIIVTTNNISIYGQDTIKTKKHYGVRINSFYDFQIKQQNSFRIIKVAPVFSFGLANHNFYLGPQYTYVFQLVLLGDLKYEQNSFGLNFGYRYYSNELFKNGKLFGQFDYSVFQIKYKEYQLGPPFMTEVKKVIAENTVSIGLDYRVLKRIHLSLSIGFGSFDSFFLMINEFDLTSHFGIQYEFK